MQDTGREYTSIAELAARSGISVPCAGNLPVKLDDPDSVWFIDRGAVNLFLVEFNDGVEQAAPQHLMRRESGWLLPGVAPDEPENDEETTLSLVAKGLPGTLLKRLPASLLSEVHPAELAEQTDTWLTALTDTLSRFASRLPRPTALAEPGMARTLAPCTLSVRREVVWVSEPPRGACLFMDIVDPAELAGGNGPREAPIPLTRTSWLTLFDEATLSGKSTETLAEEGDAAAGAGLLPRGCFRPGTAQPPTGRSRRCEPRTRADRQPPHGRESCAPAAFQYLRSAVRPGRRRRGHGPGGRPAGHRPP